jgi:predicted nucleotidyltransferase
LRLWCEIVCRIIKKMNLEESLKFIRKTIYKHLPKEEYEVFVFGSRADGTAEKWSDIDVGIRGRKAASGLVLENMREELEESDIPYKVEVVDFAKVPDKFRNFALKEVVKL